MTMNPLIGKGGKTQKMAPGTMGTITGGNVFARMMGNYAKKPPAPLDAGPAAPGASDPTMHGNAHSVRPGGMKKHPKLGGIGPGPNGSYGSATSYPKQSMNPEDGAQ
jgi:hypothetical protein